MSGQKGRSGRPTKPKALHIAQGTYRDDRHGSKLDSAAVSALPAIEWKPPEKLTIAARAMWDLLTPTMVETGRLTLLDYPLWCQCWIEYGRMAMCASKDGGGWTQENEQDVKFLHPDYSIHKDARTAFISIAAQFGLSPRTRSSVLAPLDATRSAPTSKMGQFLGKHGR